MLDLKLSSDSQKCNSFQKPDVESSVTIIRILLVI